MPKPMIVFVLTAVCLTAPAAAPAQSARGDRLYRMTLLRAAPGRLLDLVQDVKSRVAANAKPEAGRPIVLRHSQGDHWDLFVLIPTGGDPVPVDRTSLAAPELVAWQQDEVVRGPDLASFPGFADANLCHIEMFVSLAGKRDELVREREMENAYARALGRPRPSSSASSAPSGTPSPSARTATGSTTPSATTSSRTRPRRRRSRPGSKATARLARTCGRLSTRTTTIW